jgi:hypothetical protein
MGHAVITWDRADPLAQAAGESRRANQALRDYAAMGPERSLRRLHERYVQQPSNNPPTGFHAPTTSFTTLSTWSLKHDWVARVERWDGLAAQEAEAAWRERREEEREEEWQLTRALFRRGREMLDYPLVVEVEDEDGKMGRVSILGADVAKNRNGPTGVVMLRFDRPFFKMEEVEEGKQLAIAKFLKDERDIQTKRVKLADVKQPYFQTIQDAMRRADQMKEPT